MLISHRYFIWREIFGYAFMMMLSLVDNEDAAAVNNDIVANMILILMEIADYLSW